MISIELILASIIVNIILFFSILVKVIYKLLPSSCFTTIHGGASKKKANPKKIKNDIPLKSDSFISEIVVPIYQYISENKSSVIKSDFQTKYTNLAIDICKREKITPTLFNNPSYLLDTNDTNIVYHLQNKYETINQKNTKLPNISKLIKYRLMENFDFNVRTDPIILYSNNLSIFLMNSVLSFGVYSIFLIL